MRRVAPIAVVDWERSNPAFQLVAAAVLSSAVASARLLVRERGRPLAWLHVEAHELQRSAEAFQHLVETRLQALPAPPLVHAKPSHSVPGDASAVLAGACTLPSISVIVCTRDRTESLARCLESLLCLEYPAFEIVVVDNAPGSESTATLVESLQRADVRAHQRLRYARESTPGLDWARNRGLDEARHAIIAYTDDDVCVDGGWLGAIAQAFADANVQLVTGLVVPAELATAAQVAFEDWYGGMGKGMVARDFHPRMMSTRDRLGAHHLGVGANMAFRAEWLRRLGGFDSALDVGTASHGGGDLDIFHRTLLAGGNARYEPEAIVRHYHRQELDALKRQLRDNGRAFGVYLLSRWSTHERPRMPVLTYAVGVWLAWMLMRIPRRLLGRERLPLTLQREELLGVLEAPSAWRTTYADDHLRRAQTP